MKIIKKALLFTLLLVVVIALFNFNTIKRLYNVIHLFDEEVIVENFRNMDEIFEVSIIPPSASKIEYPKKLSFQLPNSFTFNNKQLNTEQFLSANQLEGLMILRNDTIIYEDYRLGLKPIDTHIGWSVSKSIVSSLLGIAYDEGLFKIDDPITNYLSQFKNTGYDTVLIKDILQMSSGVQFNEDYGDFNSDINRFARTFALGGSLEEFSKSLNRDLKPGTFNHYVSIDTQVLGMLLKKITGKSLTSLYKEKLWEPLGMQDSCEWIIDETGMEMALGGLNMTLRDFSKIGQLYLHKGFLNNRQLISEEWIKMSITPDAPHLKPGKRTNASHEQGYGFQWWIPVIDQGDFFAAGIYDQYIYISPSSKLVIVALSANHEFKNKKLGGEIEHIALFKEIADILKL
jgi:hypothetical protein